MDIEVRDDRLVEWFKKWRKPIRSWLRNRASVSPGEVDDLAQEVFLRLLRYSDEVAVDNPQGYLFRIAANVANEWRERSRVRKPHDDSWLDDLEILPEHQPEQTLEAEDMRRVVRAAFSELSTRQQIILQMHVYDELTYKQIAKELGLTYRIVLRELTRSYASLKARLFRVRDLAG